MVGVGYACETCGQLWCGVEWRVVVLGGGGREEEVIGCFTVMEEGDGEGEGEEGEELEREGNDGVCVLCMNMTDKGRSFICRLDFTIWA